MALGLRYKLYIPPLLSFTCLKSDLHVTVAFVLFGLFLWVWADVNLDAHINIIVPRYELELNLGQRINCPPRKSYNPHLNLIEEKQTLVI